MDRRFAFILMEACAGMFAGLVLLLTAGCARGSSYSPYYPPQTYAPRYSAPTYSYSPKPVTRLSRLSKVSYSTDEGWSDEALVEVQFMTGRQFNAATTTFDYDMFANYALIWFAR